MRAQNVGIEPVARLRQLYAADEAANFAATGAAIRARFQLSANGGNAAITLTRRFQNLVAADFEAGADDRAAVSIRAAWPARQQSQSIASADFEP